MIVVGCCVGPGGRYEQIAGPSLERVLRPDDRLLLVEGTNGICTAYNTVLAAARTLPECEGVLLVHDDVELLEDDVRDRLSAALAEPGVGLVGVAGGRDLVWGKWWSGRALAGRTNDTASSRGLGAPSADVDAVDGCLMLVAAAALHLDFDVDGFPGFHGYDVDYSLQVRSAGLRVVTRPIGYRHVDKGSLGDGAAFETAMRALEAKWPTWIRPLSRFERVTRKLAAVGRRG